MHALPWGPDQAATKTDIAELRAEIKASSAEVIHRLFFAMVASNATLVGLVFAAVKLA